MKRLEPEEVVDLDRFVILVDDKDNGKECGLWWWWLLLGERTKAVATDPNR